MNILLIEDNVTIVKGLKYLFETNNYNIESKDNIRSSKEYLENNKPDLIILDVMLPDGNGFNLFENVIKEKNIPVIFLTARDETDDIVKGLNIGADDYITKPFSSKELLARVNKVLNRRKKNYIISYKNIKFDMDKMYVYKNDEQIELTSLELKLLYLLFLNIGKVVTRESMLESIWENTGNDVDDHTLTVYLKRIREKIGDDVIKTIKKVGYIIDGE